MPVSSMALAVPACAGRINKTVPFGDQVKRWKGDQNLTIAC